MASDGEVSCANDPNFAVIYSFLKAFGELYGLDVPSLLKLQESIDNTQEVSEYLKELHLRLLRRALKSAQSNRWERCLIKFCHQQGYHQEAWEIERFTYKKASTQVKLKVLKLLLEYQFTCHPKFKTAVNAIPCKDLRLDPIGRDKNGCVYWLQVDHEANLRLYQEDQDEETWQLVARNREGLVKVISQLKNGEDIVPLNPPNNLEDIGSGEFKSDPDLDIQNEPLKEDKNNGEVNDDNEEEFLSPESESDNDNEDKTLSDNIIVKSKKQLNTEKEETEKKSEDIDIHNEDDNKDTEIEKDEGDGLVHIEVEKDNEEKTETFIDTKQNTDSKEETSKEEKTGNNDADNDHEGDLEVQANKLQTHEIIENKSRGSIENTGRESNKVIEETLNINKESPETCEESIEKSDEMTDATDNQSDEEFSETIEEPVMVVTGEGNGADCESSYIIGEEITEEVMYFFGEGCGYDNDTGNPETVEHESAPEQTDEDNVSEDRLNGEHPIELSNIKKVKVVKLKTCSSVTKRSLKKQSNDTTEVLNVDSKKHCIRDADKSESSNSNGKNLENDTKLEFNNDKSDSETTRNILKKNRGKVKKKSSIKKIKFRDSKEIINSVSETDNCHDNKSSIIEKRKSSVSSEHDKESENDKEDSPEKDLKVEDPLPPKKLRLEPTPDTDTTHSKENVEDSLGNGNEDILDQPIYKRKKIKANKSKLKVKKIIKDNIVNKETDKKNSNEKKVSKSLKRSLLNTTVSDKHKAESQSESEEEEQMTSRKRLKVKPKRILMSSRKKVEAKLQDRHSSDESEEETLYSLASKRPTKKLKKKPKEKDKKTKPLQDKKQIKKEASAQCEDDDSAPVRQSRRIAQMKIKEEAERRHIEEVTLRELKMIHKKKGKEDEEEWRASGCSSGSEGGKRAKARGRDWRSESTGPEPDSDSDEPLFEEPHHHEEPDLDYDKSDHEFSPESDLECDGPAEPLKRARTLQEGQDDGFCKSCGSGEQPEWILLCDKCDVGYHASCLKPMLFLVPEGNWYCPPCSHELLIAALEKELVKYDELVERVEAEIAKRKQQEPEAESSEKDDKKAKSTSSGSESGSSSETSSSSSSSGGVYRLRARRHAPVSYRAQEYDRLISSAIKEEYVEPTTSAGNQGRGKDISTIIEAAEEEKLKAEREALEQGKPIEIKKLRKKQRRKPRKLNSLDVPSEDDDETDEDFKDTGMESSSEEISTSAERDSSSDSRSSDSLPIRRTCRSENKKERTKIVESSPEVKKKKGAYEDSSSESAGTKDWATTNKKSKHSKHSKHPKHSKHSRRDKSGGGKRHKRRRRKRSALAQYDAEGNVVRARVTYGGLSDDARNDWSPKHRTRQKKINYTEMPNTESEDEMHKSSGKHMPDSSDEFKISESELSSDSEWEKAKRAKAEAEGEGAGEGQGAGDEERRRAISEALAKASSAVVPLEKLPEEVAKAKAEELQAHLDAKIATNARPHRGRGGRGGRGSRGSRSGRGGVGGGGAGAAGGPRAPPCDEALARLVGVKIKDLSEDGAPLKPNQVEREKKRQEREAKQAEKEARKQERLQKKEEKEKMKEQKAKEREEKRLARLALQESKRMKKEKPEFGGNMGGFGPSGDMRMNMYGNAPIPIRHPGDFQEQRFPATPRLQVRAELRGVISAEDRMAQAHHEFPPNVIREGTLSVAGSPQPFKPVSEEPSIITRMPHMLNQQYRGPMMYPGGAGYGPRPPQGVGMYPLHTPRHQYAPRGYYQPHASSLPPGYPPRGPHATPPPANGGPHPSTPHMGPRPPGLPPNAMPYRPPGYGPRPGPSFSNSPSPMPPTSSPLPLRPGGVPPGGPIRSMTPPTPMSTPPGEPPVKIKAEVKTEPEYRSPVGSPSASPAPPSSPGAPPREEPPRHPKIKVTENKDRRPRYPLGPYAPQYGPYGPYAPGPGPPERSVSSEPFPRGPPPSEAFPRGPPPHEPFPRATPPLRYLLQELRPPSPARRHPTPPEGASPLAMTPPLSRPSPSPLESAPPSYLSAQLRASPRPPPFGAMMAPRPHPPPPLGAYRPPPPPRSSAPPRLERVPSPARLESLGVGAAGGEAPVAVAVRRAPTPAAPEPPLVKTEAPEPPDADEGGVFGGLVSYFSSQREDDLDAAM